MAAEIETMMYAGETPWHGLGTRVPANLPWSDAIVAAGLDWTVQMQRAFIRDMRDGERKAVECTGYRAVVRSTDSAVLGIGTERYQPIQNREMFSLFESAFGDRAVLETAGALRGGKEVWGLARIPGEWTIGRDKHLAYMLVTGGHDTRHDVKALPTMVRVVCKNTQRAALNAASRAKKGTFERGYSVRHIGDTSGRLDKVRDMVAEAFGTFNGWADRMRALQDAPLSNIRLKDLLASIIPGDSGKATAAREGIIHLASNGKGNEAYRGTAYAALQGVTEYVDHHRLTESTAERRFLYQTDGAGGTLKDAAEYILVSEFAPGLLAGVPESDKVLVA